MSDHALLKKSSAASELESFDPKAVDLSSIQGLEENNFLVGWEWAGSADKEMVLTEKVNTCCSLMRS